MPGFGTLVLLRHGESVLNAAGRFTGLLDPPLTARGRCEAKDAARLLAEAGLLPTAIFSSTLVRATETADIVARTLGMAQQPVRLWKLNERNYGSLTGRSKAELRTEFGEDVLHCWRRTLYGTPPTMDQLALGKLRRSPALAGVPAGAVLASESLIAVSKRVGEVWLHVLRPLVLEGETVLCVGHGNSLRALCFLLDELSEAEVEALNIPTGQPLLYRFDGWALPFLRGGRYLNPLAARTAAEQVAAEGGT
ncbi:2,3-diphosphoglycerate-dependent phosphoglycerate mutase [Arthrobacter livingstonensis]|uniref:2,3-bisphosphoglycerate-dependent phosphoglycerate mutase n=1 Tax=Arthrobacter livingstonensis TaxID=670078 RepID=A0A2V5L202_9MICC|nr:2,3-bisphosphoglycerate-dependent phosphoglycerate mutase [Arthrobacter livingstonensis]PYI65068.1 2,3-diphosphoglycerate-dependent phosphoglycerate mutase [Arthrobacter livingstonensis]